MPMTTASLIRSNALSLLVSPLVIFDHRLRFSGIPGFSDWGMTTMTLPGRRAVATAWRNMAGGSKRRIPHNTVRNVISGPL